MPPRRRLATWLVGQVAVLHSPADLSLMLLVAPPAVATDGQDAVEEWPWVRWLPHVRRPDDSPEIAAVATDRESVGRRVAELTATLGARREAAASTGAGVAFAPVLVVLDGARALRLLPGMVPLLREGPSYGLFFLCLDADVTQLPGGVPGGDHPVARACASDAALAGPGHREQPPSTACASTSSPTAGRSGWAGRWRRSVT